jgi:small redox-active disulfide protein 2
MLSIKILGPGCPNCEQVETLAKQAVSNLALEARIEKITDRAQMQAYNLLATPGLVVNEKLVCAGRIPGEGEVVTWLIDALEVA